MERVSILREIVADIRPRLVPRLTLAIVGSVAYAVAQQAGVFLS